MNTPCNAQTSDKAGIYVIKNIINGKVYIGSAKQLRTRKANHYMQLKNNKHHSNHLQKSFNKYGKDNFKFEIIELIEDKNLLIKREQYWIDTCKSYIGKYGYNTVKFAASTLGYRHTAESKRKMSINSKGKKASNETRLKMSRAQLGNKNSIGNKNTLGHKLSEEHKKKVSIARMGKYTGENNPFYGKKHTEETKEKIRQMNIGKKYSIEIRKKQSDIRKGKKINKPRTKLMREKRSKAMLGKYAGENNPSAKLTKDSVIKIKELLKQNLLLREIAKLFNVSICAISDIKAKRTWKNT